jgi:putative tryptophan/tyrosine transport system substrate-binding protein
MSRRTMPRATYVSPYREADDAFWAGRARMNRRRVLLTFLSLGLGLSGARGAGAQAPAKLPVIGLLDAGQRVEWWAAFRKEMRELGYIEGQTIAFEERFANGKFERLAALAEELVRLKVSVIVTSGTVTAGVATNATRTIPIVMATGDDPVAGGLVKSLARPGGNLTGVTSLNGLVMGKRFEQFREALPKITRVALLWHRDNAASATQVRDFETTARPSKITLQSVAVKTSDELPQAFVAMTRERAGGVFVVSGPTFFSERQRLADLALKHRLPSMYSQSEHVDAGGLLSYGPSYPGLFRQAAHYVDKILKGANPGDLPIEQPTTFELVINLKTARALGITLPSQTLLRATRSIQ